MTSILSYYANLKSNWFHLYAINKMQKNNKIHKTILHKRLHLQNDKIALTTLLHPCVELLLRDSTRVKEADNGKVNF